MYVESLSEARTKLTTFYPILGMLKKAYQRRSLPPRSPLKPALARKRPERLRAGRLPLCRAHVLWVRSARHKSCGLAGQTFLNIPLTTWGRRHWPGQFRKYDSGVLCVHRPTRDLVPWNIRRDSPGQRYRNRPLDFSP